MRKLPSLLVLCLVACSPGESAPPPPDPLPKPLTTTPTPGAVARREKTTTLTCLPELPPGAEAALLAIRNAADAGDLGTLRGWLAPGMDPGLDRPERRRALVATLDQGCLEDETGQRVLCPPAHRFDPAYKGTRAGIARLPQGWRLTFFIVGD